MSFKVFSFSYMAESLILVLIAWSFFSDAEAGPVGGPDKVASWRYQGHISNEFNYANLGQAGFNSIWKRGYINSSPGPNRSIYSGAQAYISNGGQLALTAARQGNRLFGGTVHSKNKVRYPVYVEARVKVSNSSLASNVWMLNSQSNQEIDVLESWGNKNNRYFSRVLHLSHHIFWRDGEAILGDYQPTSGATYYQRPNGQGDYVVWPDDYHVYGILWDGPYSLHYYIDGQWVRTTPPGEIDPYGWSAGLNDSMHLILNTEAQKWRESQGINYFNDASVSDPTRNTMYVDWIRVWKP